MLLTFLAGCPWIPEPTAAPPGDTGEACTTSVYADADGDGYGDPDVSQPGCEGDGWVADQDDCDDGNADIHPGVAEVCDGVDQDCNGEIDDDPTDGEPWYYDRDGDTYGDPESVAYFCDGDAPGDRIAVADDCDDNDPGVNPDADEVCDDEDVDEDCSGAADDDDPSATGQTPWYRDGDEDGYGVEDAAPPTYSCDGEPGLSASADDCNDSDAAIHPGADETDCTDPVDYNCDGSVGYADADGDGHVACLECDDSNADVHPGADELCNDRDDDCDIEIDEDAIDPATWYCDTDGDGFGDADCTIAACDLPAGYSELPTDCDDGEIGTYPGAREDVADGIDQDCDGGDTCYCDVDTDGYTDGSTCPSADLDCEDSGEADASTPTEDCDDTDPSTNPAAIEVCDGDDDDCDGEIDEVSIYTPTWFRDGDGDGYGDAEDSVEACEAPEGYVADSSDCDDEDASANPAGTEACGGGDEDCDGYVDEAGASGEATWYADSDGDGYGDASVTDQACAAPAGYVEDATDCDDGDAAVSPSATESCATAYDDDCSGSTNDEDAAGCMTFFYDGDGDFYGDPDGGRCQCSASEGYPNLNDDDCDDTDASVSPAGTEACNDVDDDCDGEVDEAGASGETTWYADSDGDGYGDTSVTTEACDAPAGYVDNDDDCDDADASVGPCILGADDAGAVLGGTAGDRAGNALAILDDVDRDGDDELAVGAFYSSNGGITRGGGVYLVPGGVTGVDDLTAVAQAFLYGNGVDDAFGNALAAVPDIDADGLPELFVGAEWHGGGLDGAVYGYHVSASWSGPIATTEGYSDATADASNDHLGVSVAALGTFTDDALPDVAIGAYDSDVGTTNAGAVYTIAATNEGFGAVYSKMGTLITGAASNDKFGVKVCAAGDTDGDGGGDLLAGAAQADGGGTDNGAVYLVLAGSESSAGGAAGTVSVSDVADRTWYGLAANDSAYFCAEGGDVDGDGYADILLAAPGVDDAGTNRGAAYLFMGTSATGSIPTSLSDAEATWTGTEDGGLLGYRAEMSGDLDADGAADLVLASPYSGEVGDEAGSVYLFLGAQSGAVDLSDADLQILGASPGDNFGSSLAVGDLDGSGRGDLAVGAPLRGSYEGAISIFYDPL